MINIAIQQENSILINVYAWNIGAQKYIKEILMGIKEDNESNTVIIGDFNTVLTAIGKRAFT